MKISIALFVLLSISTSQIVATSGQSIFCAGYDWQNIKNIPQDKFECGLEFADGHIELSPKYTRIVKKYLHDRPKPTVHNNTKSTQLFGSDIFSRSGNFGSAYIKEDGTGYRMVFFDNGPDYFKNGVARFLASGKMGFINKQANVVIAAKFDFVSPFLDGYARICQGCRKEIRGEHSRIVGGHWNDIDMKGNVVIAPMLAPIKIKIIPQVKKHALNCRPFCNSRIVRQVYKKHCMAGNSTACTGYGKLLSELVISGWALGRNYDLEFHKIKYSSFFEFSDINNKDFTKITKSFLQKQCFENKNLQLCAVLSFHKYNDGEITEAQELLRNACQNNFSWACANLGYLKDLDFEHDAAKKYYTLGCQLKNSVSCFNLGTSQYRDDNIEQAKAIFKKSCANGQTRACEVLKIL